MKIALNQLKPDPNNIRKVKAGNLDNLVASIQSRDLLHNLVVKKNGSGYHVVDGNRRLQALQQIHGVDSIEEIECKVIDQHDREIGLHANMMREGMHALDEADVIFGLVSKGDEDYDSVAKRFGQTDKWVKQRVALTELDKVVKKAFRNCEMNLKTASLFTQLNKTQQKELFESCDGKFDYGDIKWKIERATIAKKDVIIPPTHELYKEIEFAGDLFSDRQYAADTNKFLQIQEQYVSEWVSKQRPKYEKVHYLGDTPLYDATNIIKNLTKDFDKGTYKNADLQLTVHYDPRRGEFYSQKWLDKKKASAKEIEAVRNGEVPELTLADMSNPQHEDMMNMYWQTTRDVLNVYVPEQPEVLAHLCASITEIYDLKFKSVKPKYDTAEIDKEGNPLDPVDAFAEETKIYSKACVEDYNERYKNFLKMGETDCFRYLFIRLMLSKDREDTFEFNKKYAKAPIDPNWFQPTHNWINKYKTKQLYMLADHMKVEYSERDKKGDLVEKIKGGFREGKTFNPIKFMSDLKK